MNAAARTPVYHMEQTTGFASMRELWKAALFLSDLLGWQVIIEGVTHVAPADQGVYLNAPTQAETFKRSGMNVTPERPKFAFKRRSGLAKFSDLEVFAAFVREQLMQRMQSKDLVSGSGSPGSARTVFRKDPPP